jgi:hypothetical protein
MTPDEQQIIASHWIQQDQFPGESSEAWSGLLIGSIVTYGLLPRALLLVLSLGMAWRTGRQFRLDMSLPGYSRLRVRLLPEAQLIGVIDAETTHAGEEHGVAIEKGRLLPIVAQGPTAILGFEIKPPPSFWPPQLKGVEWLDLGFVDSRGDRQRALQQILAAAIPPRVIVVVCSLVVTPDRGARAFISDLQKASRIPVVIVLTEGQRLRSRGYDEKQLGERIEDWHQLAKAAHIPPGRVIAVDLEHLTTVSLAKFASLLGVGGQEISFEQRLDRSFGLIMEHVKCWSGEPSVGEQAELHRAIAALYRGEQQSWQTLLNIRLKRSDDQLQQLKTSAERVVNLLPARLRANPRWLAAGAMAGALGCVAAATLVTPAAITALPAWAGLGAAIAAIVQFPKRSAAKPAAVDLTDAVSSAALFALLLELQGHDEITITRLIDRVAGDDDSVLDNAEAVWQWLAALRQRLDLALAAEGAV